MQVGTVVNSNVDECVNSKKGSLVISKVDFIQWSTHPSSVSQLAFSVSQFSWCDTLFFCNPTINVILRINSFTSFIYCHRSEFRYFILALAPCAFLPETVTVLALHCCNIDGKSTGRVYILLAECARTCTSVAREEGGASKRIRKRAWGWTRDSNDKTGEGKE